MTAYHPQDLASERGLAAEQGLPAHPGAGLAGMVRSRLKRPPPPLPRADGALLKAAFAIMLTGALATGLALYWTHQDEEREPLIQPARIGSIALMVPQNLTGSEPDDSSRLVGMVRLRLDWPSLGPAQTGPTEPDGRGFAARCPLDAGKSDPARPDLDEPCRVTFKHRGMDVNIRFPRGIIADWELMLGGVRNTIDGMMR